MTTSTPHPLRPTGEQRAIIEYPLRPLRVAAGAGTGKTTTMALRLAHLVSQGSVEPERALGITFTRKAARELADRVREHASGFHEDGRAVEVFTYHGFAHSIVEEFGALVGVERGSPVVTAGYIRQLLHDALGGDPHVHLDLTVPARRVQELAALDDRLQDHLVSLDAVVEDLRTYGELMSEDVVARRDEMVATLRRFRDRKRALGVVGYGDLIERAHEIVTHHPDVTDRIRNRYDVVLLDEYQDTNPAQRLLLQALFGGGFPVTAVGDAAQTIYEWRGASLANFARFEHHFAGADPIPTLELSVNRRSGDGILELANAVRARIGDEPGRPLTPTRDAPLSEIHVGWFANPAAEATFITTTIARLVADGVPLDEIAVLFRKHRHIPLIRDHLEAADIPSEVASLGGLLHVPVIAELHAWLRLLGRPHDDPALVRLLTGARHRLGLGDLAPLVRWRRARTGGRDDGEGRYLLEALEHLDDIPDLRHDARRRLGRFHDEYGSLLVVAQGVELVELCRRVLDTAGFWPEIAAHDEASRLSARLNLYRFLDLAEEWSPLEGRPSLVAFLDHLDVLAQDEHSEELDTAPIRRTQAVTLTTVHRAKGLEWTAVFLPALVRDVFPARSRQRDHPLRRAESMPYRLRADTADLAAMELEDGALDDELKRRDEQQEWRVAYVATTRARRLLYGTGAFWHFPRKPTVKSELYELFAAQPSAIVEEDAEAPGLAPEVLTATDTATAPDPHFPDGWMQVLRKTVEDPDYPRRLAGEGAGADAFEEQRRQLTLMLEGLPDPLPLEPDPALTTSVTGLVTYAECPRRFYWREVDSLPLRPDPRRRRGVEVHRRIELHARGVVALPDVDAGAYDVAEDARTLPPMDVEGHGARDPFEVFLASDYATRPTRHVEAPIDLSIGGARVRGRIDAVYEDDRGRWEIVDFKSGRRRAGGTQRVQLEAYAVAAADGALGTVPEAMAVTFAYLGGDGIEVETEPVDDAWVTDARRHLEVLIESIAAGAYEPTPSAACFGCDFVRFCDAGSRYVATEAAALH